MEQRMISREANYKAQYVIMANSTLLLLKYLELESGVEGSGTQSLCL